MASLISGMSWYGSAPARTATRGAMGVCQIAFFIMGIRGLFGRRNICRYEDARGRYQLDNLTGSGLSKGESGQPWRGFDPGLGNRHWTVPLGYGHWIEAHYIAGYSAIKGVHARLEALDKAGLIAPPPPPPPGRRQGHLGLSAIWLLRGVWQGLI